MALMLIIITVSDSVKLTIPSRFTLSPELRLCVKTSAVVDSELVTPLRHPLTAGRIKSLDSM